MLTLLLRKGFSQLSTTIPFTARSLSESSSTIQLCNKMCILGGGQMCEAILGALHTKGIQPARNISVYDVNEKRLTYLREKFSVETSRCAQTAVADSDIVIVAVKPQNVQTLATHVAIPSTGLLLSIVAGLTVDEIKKQFNTENIIRSMPNTPAMIMEGITVWMHTPQTPHNLVEKAKTLLSSFGDQVQVGEEQFLDMATAVSGSGPAVSFFIVGQNTAEIISIFLNSMYF
jgi:pyrroline-5-carboxylate reductase